MTTVRVLFGISRHRDAIRQRAERGTLDRNQITTRSFGARTLFLDFPEFDEREDPDFIRDSWLQVLEVEIVKPGQMAP